MSGKVKDSNNLLFWRKVPIVLNIDSKLIFFCFKSTYLSQGVSRNSDNKVKDEDSDNSLIVLSDLSDIELSDLEIINKSNDSIASVQLIDTQPPPTQECLIDEEEIFIKPKR